MPKVTIIEKDGRTLEVSDISFLELKELVRPNVNGNGHPTPLPVLTKSYTSERKPEYGKFHHGLSDHAKKMIVFLRQNPSGISADDLAERLGFSSTNQIGGVTGGGIAKLAAKFNIKIADVYIKEVTRENGERRVIYKPGPDIEKVL